MSPGTFSPDASRKGTTLCAPHSGIKGRFGMVEVFPPKLEWFLVLPSPLPLCPCLLGRFWELWMWGCCGRYRSTSAYSAGHWYWLLPCGRHWAGKHIRFHCDNLAVVMILSTRMAKTYTCYAASRFIVLTSASISAPSMSQG